VGFASADVALTATSLNGYGVSHPADARFSQAPAPSLANSGDDRGEGEKPCGPSGGDDRAFVTPPTHTPRVGLGLAVGRGEEESAAFLNDPEPCIYCGCVIEIEGNEPYCSPLCAVAAENEQ